MHSEKAEAVQLSDERARLWAHQIASYQILPIGAMCFRQWGRIFDRKPGELSEDAMIAARHACASPDRPDKK